MSKYTCPHCKQGVEVTHELLGEGISCSSCGKKLQPFKGFSESLSSMNELLKKPDFLELLNADIDKANAGITHDEFVAGVQAKTMGFKVMRGEPIALVKGQQKVIFNFVVTLYLIAPFFLVSFWAYHEKNWWLLFGIPIASFISPQLAQLKKHIICSFFLLAFVLLWFFKGIHNCFTFFSLCAFWGYFFFNMADMGQTQFAIESLVGNSELFYEAVEQRKIMIVRKGDASLNP